MLCSIKYENLLLQFNMPALLCPWPQVIIGVTESTFLYQEFFRRIPHFIKKLVFVLFI